MKKIYEKPAMTVVNIKSEQMICESPSNIVSNTVKLGGAGMQNARGREVVQNDWEEWDDWEE